MTRPQKATEPGTGLLDPGEADLTEQSAAAVSRALAIPMEPLRADRHTVR